MDSHLLRQGRKAHPRHPQSLAGTQMHPDRLNLRLPTLANNRMGQVPRNATDGELGIHIPLASREHEPRRPHQHGTAEHAAGAEASRLQRHDRQPARPQMYIVPKHDPGPDKRR